MTLEEMITKAENENLILYNGLEDLYFTGKGLREKNAEGLYQWHPKSFILIKPKDYLYRLFRKIEEAQLEYEKTKKILEIEGLI